MKINGLAFASLLIVAVAAIPLFGQTSGTGAISGTVTDTSGAVIPGATIVATNADTGQTRSVTTGSDGTYKFSLLPPGAYNVKFTANGFKVTEVPRLIVAVTETPVLDQKLDLGTQAEQITVEANAEAIETTNAALGTVLGGSQVTSLPLTSRNYTNTLALSAGVAARVTNAAQLGKGGMDFSVNGAKNGQNNIQIDGANVVTYLGVASNGDNFDSYSTNPVPNPDALQEFKVQTASYDAGYGRNIGANVNAITKSGTNAFHGSAFEFIRNTALNASGFFNNLSGTGKPILNQHQFGGVLGGPIKKDKLFFFVSYQGTRQKNGAAGESSTSIVLPPIPGGDRSNTAAFRAAVGAAFCPTNHPGDTRYNTLRGGVQVACDGSNINPVAIGLLQAKLSDGGLSSSAYLFPASTTGTFQNTTISVPATFNENQELANADYLLSSKHTLALRFFNSKAPFLLSFAGGSSVPGFTLPGFYFNTTALMKVTSVLTPSVVNEFRANMNRGIFSNTGNNTTFSDHQFGVTPVSPYQDFNVPGFMSTFSITGAYSVGGGNSDYGDGGSVSYQLADQISWTHGKHTVRAGFEAEQIRLHYSHFSTGQGGISFSTFSDFLMGRAGCEPAAFSAGTCSAANPGNTTGTAFSNVNSTSAAQGLSPAGPAHVYYVPDYSAFVNDDIKVSQRLTVNVGLRWEFFGLGTDTHGVLTNVWPSAIWTVPVPGSTEATGSLAGWIVPANYFDAGQTHASVPGSPKTLNPGVTLAPNNSSLAKQVQKDNFAPRFGFAWQPLGGNKFVVRGGYGFFYDRPSSQSWQSPSGNAPPYAPVADNSGVGNYYATLAVPFKKTENKFPNRWVNFTTLTTSGIVPRFFGPIWLTPRLQSYNLGIQYNFFPSWVLEVGYVGSHGTHLANRINFNSAGLASATNPIWGVTTNTVSNAVVRVPYLGFTQLNGQEITQGDSRYNSLQITLRKQISRGFQAQVAFTWATAMTDYQPTQNLNDLSENYGRNPEYQPRRLSINYSYNLPSGNFKGIAGKLASGWSLSGITSIQTGTPITITDGRGQTIYGLNTSRAQIAAGKTYADIATPGDLKSRLGGATGGCGYFTSTATVGSLNSATCGSLSAITTVPLAVAPDGTVTNGTGYGNMGIGVILGPGQFNFDASLTKMTKVGGIHEDSTLQFRAEFFNAMNHAQFSNPAANVSAAGTFGQITGTTVNPRLIQLALKYIF